MEKEKLLINKASKLTIRKKLLTIKKNKKKFNQYINIITGLDGAGKSTALYRMKFNQYINTVPTIGFNCERIRQLISLIFLIKINV